MVDLLPVGSCHCGAVGAGSAPGAEAALAGAQRAVVQGDERAIGVVDMGGLGGPEFQGCEAEPVDDGGETVDLRIARRRGSWGSIAFALTARLAAEQGCGGAARFA